MDNLADISKFEALQNNADATPQESQPVVAASVRNIKLSVNFVTKEIRNYLKDLQREMRINVEVDKMASYARGFGTRYSGRKGVDRLVKDVTSQVDDGKRNVQRRVKSIQEWIDIQRKRLNSGETIDPRDRAEFEKVAKEAEDYIRIHIK